MPNVLKKRHDSIAESWYWMEPYTHAQAWPNLQKLERVFVAEVYMDSSVPERPSVTNQAYQVVQTLLRFPLWVANSTIVEFRVDRTSEQLPVALPGTVS